MSYIASHSQIVSSTDSHSWLTISLCVLLFIIASISLAGLAFFLKSLGNLDAWYQSFIMILCFTLTGASGVFSRLRISRLVWQDIKTKIPKTIFSRGRVLLTNKISCSHSMLVGIYFQPTFLFNGFMQGTEISQFQLSASSGTKSLPSFCLIWTLDSRLLGH